MHNYTIIHLESRTFFTAKQITDSSKNGDRYIEFVDGYAMMCGISMHEQVQAWKYRIHEFFVSDDFVKLDFVIEGANTDAEFKHLVSRKALDQFWFNTIFVRYSQNAKIENRRTPPRDRFENIEDVKRLLYKHVREMYRVSR